MPVAKSKLSERVREDASPLNRMRPFSRGGSGVPAATGSVGHQTESRRGRRSHQHPARKSGTVRDILRRLHRAYPDVQCALHHDNPLQLLVATILSAQCTDARVNRVTPALFRRYHTAADFAAAPRGELETLIRSTGFYRHKARAIRNCCRAIAEQYDGRVPDALPALVQLQGVGRKTANVVLGVAYGKAEGVVVDTHVTRLSRRLGLTRQRTPEKIERDLMKIVPPEQWIDWSHLLIWHGRRRCTARKPDCAHCELVPLCPQIGVRTQPRMTANTRE